MKIKKIMDRLFKQRPKETIIHVKACSVDESQSTDNEVLLEFLKSCDSAQEKRAVSRKNMVE